MSVRGFLAEIVCVGVVLVSCGPPEMMRANVMIGPAHKCKLLESSESRCHIRNKVTKLS